MPAVFDSTVLDIQIQLSDDEHIWLDSDAMVLLYAIRMRPEYCRPHAKGTQVCMSAHLATGDNPAYQFET